MKFLLLIAVIGAVLWWTLGRERRVPPPRASRPAPPEPMVRCAHCGVHLPRGEALAEGDQLYCSESHRALGVTR